MASASSRKQRIQYQHYVPRFVLRKFLEIQGPPMTARQRDKKNKQARKKGIETELLNIYDFSTKTLEARSLANNFGEINLYNDITHSIDSQHVEKKLAALESEAAQVIAIIQNSLTKDTFTLTRKSLGVLRKFIYIMHVRTMNIRDMYYGKGKDAVVQNWKIMKDWTDHYMKEHNLKSSEDIWLKHLSYILDTPHSHIVREGEIIEEQGSYVSKWLEGNFTFNIGTRGQFFCDGLSIRSQHLLYFGVWEAAPETQFVVSNGSFGLWEGVQKRINSHVSEPANVSQILPSGGRDIHRLHVISPNLAIVLRNLTFKMVKEKPTNWSIDSSLVDVNMADPVTDATFKLAGSANSREAVLQFQKYRITPVAQKDTYTYSTTKLTEQQTQAVNDVILLNTLDDGSLVIASKKCALKTIRTYLTDAEPSTYHVMDTDPHKRYFPLVIKLETLLSPYGSQELDSDYRLRVVLEVLRQRLIPFHSEWDDSYWCYRAMTADPNQLHPLAIEMRIRLSQAKYMFTDYTLNIRSKEQKGYPNLCIVDTLSAEDSTTVLQAASEAVGFLMRYELTKRKSVAAIVKGAMLVGLVEWMVKEDAEYLKSEVGTGVFGCLTRI